MSNVISAFVALPLAGQIIVLAASLVLAVIVIVAAIRLAAVIGKILIRVGAAVVFGGIAYVALTAVGMDFALPAAAVIGAAAAAVLR